MPIHDLGYRDWKGETTSLSFRWVVIATTGIRLAWKSQWLRRMLFVAWIPAIYLGVGFFLYEQGLTSPGMQRGAAGFLRQSVPELDQDMLRQFQEDPRSTRHYVWALLLFTFFRYPQGMLMVMLIGLVAPPLISTDVRTRSFLLYFSRPIDQFGYILGKATVVWAYLAMITTLPALALYLLGILLSPSFSVVLDTWDLPFRILAASMVLAVPTTSLALCFSSMTAESRYAGFAWFAVWVVGFVAYQNFSFVDTNTFQLSNRWSLVSLYHTLGLVQSWIFDVGGTSRPGQTFTAALMLVVITVVTLMILMRRVSAPLRI